MHILDGGVRDGAEEQVRCTGVCSVADQRDAGVYVGGEVRSREGVDWVERRGPVECS